MTGKNPYKYESTFERRKRMNIQAEVNHVHPILNKRNVKIIVVIISFLIFGLLLISPLFIFNQSSQQFPEQPSQQSPFENQDTFQGWC